MNNSSGSRNNKREYFRQWLNKVASDGEEIPGLEAYYLGKLCKKLHDWQETGKSIRYKCDSKCVRCRLGDDWIPQKLRLKQTEEERKAKAKRYRETHSAEAVSTLR